MKKIKNQSAKHNWLYKTVKNLWDARKTIDCGQQ